MIYAAEPSTCTSIVEASKYRALADGLDLDQLSAEINGLVRDAQRAAGEACGKAIRAGVLLKKAKADVPHGQWESWLVANCTVAPRTAQAYMRLATKLSEAPPEIRNVVADLPLREAIKAIGTSPEAPKRFPNGRLAVSWTAAQRFGQAMRKNANAIRGLARNVEGNYAKRREVEAARARLQATIDHLDAYLAEAAA